MGTRRDHLKLMAGFAALPVATAPTQPAVAQQTSATPPRARSHHQLGRTPGYRDWAIVPKGLTITSVESFLQEPYALVRITASDGGQGWGQIAPYNAGLSVDMLHGVVARSVLKRDISEIDALNDRAINAAMKFPWSFVCRALAGVDTALWDLYGQITERPVAVLLGGTVRPLPAYGSSMRRDISPADEAARLARLARYDRRDGVQDQARHAGRREPRRRARPERGDHPGGAPGGRAGHQALRRR